MSKRRMKDRRLRVGCIRKTRTRVKVDQAVGKGAPLTAACLYKEPPKEDEEKKKN